ncbi:CRISPR-associated helicase Cas3' [Clostridium tyrobutyricum]|uniref:CRISPR-associated helicase Cas3' n=1 Tax=Clostridium tyrobutyricum TaxID=1519 RepID=UPI001C384DDC|nr:CRISPR-associated helicase Cas3' [Clostridium tyrobutyricum]MBV4417620.1 CRISPR-associated helicase Cas3' [Clostridium tyrobutyricum]
MLYAKSDPIESIRDHTDELLKNYEELKKTYGEIIEQKLNMDIDDFWQLLNISILYHDVGKSYTQFQNKIRKVLKEEEIPEKDSTDIPHNYLSPTLVPYNKYNIFKNRNFKKILVQAIAYHHERDRIPNLNEIKEAINLDLKNNIGKIREEMKIEIPDKPSSKIFGFMDFQNRITEDKDEYNDYIMLKGLLHRIDHSASAHSNIELDRENNVGESAQKYVTNNFGNLRNVQIFCKDNKKDNVILIASTGMGKTESALMWIDNDKGFFTLPLRVTLNALFSRINNEIGYKSAGLLHSTSLDYLEENGFENSEELVESARLFSKKLSFTTIDQLFKFPFKYKGYEKIYATLAYSKVVIDEIQSYTPKIAAAIVKGIEMIYKIGGKFLIMTATLPKIYTDCLTERGVKFNTKNNGHIPKFIMNKERHKILLRDKEIEYDIEEIVKRARNKKVLVIVNTVKKAVELYDLLKEYDLGNLNLLHSAFVKRDRSRLEKEIKDFADSKDITSGLWITTQIVEASLDVDFDYLFTELSTLDSLFQRLGRCYRKRQFDLNEPNVYIYTKDASGVGTIYDEEIFNMGLEYLKKYNNCILSERDKINLVDKLYTKENLKDTEFYKEFSNALHILDTNQEYELTGGNAQKVLRNIDSITVIPRNVYDNNMNLIDKFMNFKNTSSEEGRKYKNKLFRSISKLTADVPIYKCSNKIVKSCISDRIFVIECEYDEKSGILFDSDITNYIG